MNQQRPTFPEPRSPSSNATAYHWHYRSWHSNSARLKFFEWWQQHCVEFSYANTSNSEAERLHYIATATCCRILRSVAEYWQFDYPSCDRWYFSRTIQSSQMIIQTIIAELFSQEIANNKFKTIINFSFFRIRSEDLWNTEYQKFCN